jgi:hypothetical protein
MSYRIDMERFKIKNVSELEEKEQYRFEVSNRFAALEDLDNNVEMNISGKRLERI